MSIEELMLLNYGAGEEAKGTFHAKMGTIKDRNSKDLTEAEDIKKRWQEYTGKLYKKLMSFLGVYAQQWDCWIIRQFYFQFFKESPHCSP